MKASRLMLLGEVHRALVTDADFEGLDGVELDANLLEAAGFLEHEKVELHDLTSGSRLACEVRAAPPGTGAVIVAGAVALLVKPGERLTLAAFGAMKGKAAQKHQPRIVRVDEQNQPLKQPKGG